jgi:hypothetical protein
VNASEARVSDNLLALGSRLTDQAGFGRPRELSRLAGGKNNQVYRVDTEDGVPLLLKRYFSDPRDGRDRLSAEWSFLERAWQDGVRAIPEPLAKDADAQAALYSFVAGRKLDAGELEGHHIDAAADFILAINTQRRSDIEPASDACFSISDHLQLVERRLLRLATLDQAAPYAAKAQGFVFTNLKRTWDVVRGRTLREAFALGLDLHRNLSDAESCLSPSDFGFHNALAADDGRLTFLDFEYAGRDDPAKLVVDFFCQPEVPIPPSSRDRFVARLAALPLDEAARARCRVLLDVARVKWACILLNEFLPVGAARRAFADPSEREARCAAQLDKAKAKLDETRL